MTPDTSLLTPSSASAIAQGSFEGTAAALPFGSILPNTINTEGLTVSWTPNLRVDEDEAEFRAFDAEAAYGRTQGVAGALSLNLIPIARRMRVTERDIINHADDTGSWVKTKLTDYFDMLGRNIAFRLERAKVEALVNAKLVLDENGVKGTYDFQRKRTLTVNLTTKWNDGASNPLTDLKAWSDLIDAADGDLPGAMVTTRAVMDALAANPTIIKYAAAAANNEVAATVPNVSYQSVRNVLAQYAGISEVLVADTAYADYAKTNQINLPGGVKSYFPANTVLLLPSLTGNLVGETAIGPTAEQVSAAYGLTGGSGLSAAVFAGMNNVPGWDAYVTGTMLPVVRMANSTLTATVL